MNSERIIFHIWHAFVYDALTNDFNVRELDLFKKAIFGLRGHWGHNVSKTHLVL